LKHFPERVKSFANPIEIYKRSRVEVDNYWSDTSVQFQLINHDKKTSVTFLINFLPSEANRQINVEIKP